MSDSIHQDSATAAYLPNMRNPNPDQGQNMAYLVRIESRYEVPNV